MKQAMEVPDKDRLNLSSFALDDLKLNDDETCLAAARMFLDLDLLSKFKIPYKVGLTDIPPLGKLVKNVY